ncbi:MAG: hypothetical protein V4525_12055 [Pseudomonadota bacterium]
MFDLLAVLTVSIFLPTLLFFLIVLLYFTFRLLSKRVQFSFTKLLAAFLCTLLLEVAFVFIIGFIFALAWGHSLGYVYPVAVILLTLLFGIKTFLYLLKKDLPDLSQLGLFFKKLLSLKKIVKVKC